MKTSQQVPIFKISFPSHKRQLFFKQILYMKKMIIAPLFLLFP